MASLTNLPAELLAQILSDPTLTPLDIHNCALACRGLYDFTADRKTKYTFHIDHRSQSPYKLITCILANPRVGNRIRRLIVTWHRRNPHKPKSWTPQWLWKSQELKQIESICKKYNTEFLYPVIEDGFNSEALLPFLLCLTPNLESLDLGGISPCMIYGTDWVDTAVRIFKACDRSFTGLNYKVRHNEDDKRVYFDSRWGSSYRKDILWFYSALNLPTANRLPGLSNIKHFRHGPRFPKRRKCAGWPAEHIVKILSLPNLETASFYGAAAFEPNKTGNEYKPLSEFAAGKKSSIKQLEIANCNFGSEDYSVLAGLTGSLEKLRFTIESGWHPKDRRVSHITNTFKKHNPKILSPDQISVKRSNPRDFEFKPASDVYFRFKDTDRIEDLGETLRTYEEEKEAREYIGSRIWDYCDHEPVYDGESECDCGDYIDEYFVHSDDDDLYPTDREPDDDVALRTRDVKGSKKRSHFVGFT